jgi:hypothetical protein
MKINAFFLVMQMMKDQILILFMGYSIFIHGFGLMDPDLTDLILCCIFTTILKNLVPAFVKKNL